MDEAGAGWSGPRAVGGRGAGDGRGGGIARGDRGRGAALRGGADVRGRRRRPAAAMDHLQLALDEAGRRHLPPGAAGAARARRRGGSTWTAIELLDVEMAAATTVAARADLAVEKAYLLEHRLLARSPPAPCWKRRWRWSRGTRARWWRWRRRPCAATTPRCCVGAGAAAGGRDLRGGAGARAGPPGAAGRGQPEPARPRRWTCGAGAGRGRRARGAAALARAGRAGWPPASAGRGAGRAALELEAEATTGAERAAWLGLAAALARHRLGAAARAVALIEEARAADPNDPALLYRGRWRTPGGRGVDEARLALDSHAELSRDRDWARRCRGWGRTWPSSTRVTTRRRPRATAGCWRRGRAIPSACAGAGADRVAHG